MNAEPTTMGPLAMWAQHREQKLEWAFRAYRRFVEGLSAETREHLAQGDGDHEPYVVVYGETQVGKTTLLLELMGVLPEHMSRVSEVLRGHQGQGKSATATAMEYRRSPDTGWQLNTGSGIRRFGCDADMTSALAEVRQAMSSCRLDSDLPVVGWIPCDRFKASPEPALGARMLDLPGDNPVDDIERKHVQRMAARYVPHADLILLVGLGDGLSFLNPKKLKLPSIEDWQFVPNRFRIVTTHSFTSGSVQQFARDHDGELTPELFRQRLLDQICTFKEDGFKLSPEAARPEYFFPLEFGDTWAKLAQAQPSLFSRLTPVVDDLKRQLHADIHASATEGARFRNALDVHVVARRRKEVCLELGRKRLADVDEKLSRMKNDLCQTRSVLKSAESKAKSAQALADSMTDATWRATLEKMAAALDIALQVEKVANLGTNTDHLFVCINEFTSWLTSRFLGLRPVTDEQSTKFWGSVQPDLGLHRSEVVKRIKAVFSGLCSRMEEYWHKEYYPSVSSTFSDDKSRLRCDMYDAANEVGEIAVRLWTTLGQQRSDELLTLAKDAEAHCRSLQEVVEYQTREHSRLLGERATTEGDIDASMRKLESDEGGSARFRAMLDDEYLNELKRLKAHVMTTSSSVDAFMGLLAAATLGDERQKILIGKQ